MLEACSFPGRGHHPAHQVYFIGEGCLFFDHIDDGRNNYRFGGRRARIDKTAFKRQKKIMRTTAVLGVLLIALGLATLAYQGISYTSRETVLDVGPVHATAERQKTLPLPPVLGIAAAAGGVALLVIGRRKEA